MTANGPSMVFFVSSGPVNGLAPDRRQVITQSDACLVVFFDPQEQTFVEIKLKNATMFIQVQINTILQ